MTSHVFNDNHRFYENSFDRVGKRVKLGKWNVELRFKNRGSIFLPAILFISHHRYLLYNFLIILYIEYFQSIPLSKNSPHPLSSNNQDFDSLSNIRIFWMGNSLLGGKGDDPQTGETGSLYNRTVPSALRRRRVNQVQPSVVFGLAGKFRAFLLLPSRISYKPTPTPCLELQPFLLPDNAAENYRVKKLSNKDYSPREQVEGGRGGGGGGKSEFLDRSRIKDLLMLLPVGEGSFDFLPSLLGGIRRTVDY